MNQTQTASVGGGPSAPAAGAGGSRAAAARAWLQANSLAIGPFGALLLLILIFSVAAGSNFLSESNMTNILAQSGVIAVMATGLTFILLLGEIDLAFSAIAVLCGLSSAIFYSGTEFPTLFFGIVTFGTGNQLVAIVVALAIATLLGLLAGLLTARVGVPSFIATLGLLLLAQGWAFYWSSGNIVYDAPPIFGTLGGSTVGPIPVIAITAAVIMLIAHIVLSRTRFGRYVYMIGSNRRAAELAGVNAKRVIVASFMIAGFLAGFAGLLAVGRLGSAQPDASVDYLLPVIAATVVGGVSLFGGVGSIRATLIGVLVFAVLDNGLDQTDIDIHLKPLMRGLILLAAIVLNVVGLRLAARARLASRAEVELRESPPAASPPPAPATGA